MSEPETSDSRVKDERLQAARDYHSPRLVIYGPMRDLTAGGTGNAQEGSSGQRVRP